MTWQPIKTVPTDGTRVHLRREDCPGYDTYGRVNDGRLEMESFFIRSDMMLIKVPTHWKPIAAQVPA